MRLTQINGTAFARPTRLRLTQVNRSVFPRR